MKVKKKPMSLLQKVIYTICFFCLIGAFIFLGTRDYKVKELSDNQMFSKEYKVISENNTFQVLNSGEALTFLEKGTGVLFLGFPENKWSSSVAEILDAVSKETDYSIHYFNFKDERANNHDNYIGIVQELDDYLRSDDEGKLDVYAPTVVVLVKGKVIYFDDELAFMSNLLNPKDYWTEDKKDAKIYTLKTLIEGIKDGNL